MKEDRYWILSTRKVASPEIEHLIDVAACHGCQRDLLVLYEQDKHDTKNEDCYYRR